jgi:flagellar hook-basal body complex protein FliE
MSQMEIDRVLSQIRAIRSSATGGIAEAAQASQAMGGVESKSSVSFAAVLKGGLDKVNDAQQRARVAATDFESGKPGMDLPQVMLEMQKASVSFRGAVEVRNRLVSAYQDIMNMPV